MTPFIIYCCYIFIIVWQYVIINPQLRETVSLDYSLFLHLYRQKLIRTEINFSHRTLKTPVQSFIEQAFLYQMLYAIVAILLAESIRELNFAYSFIECEPAPSVPKESIHGIPHWVIYAASEPPGSVHPSKV